MTPSAVLQVGRRFVFVGRHYQLLAIRRPTPTRSYHAFVQHRLHRPCPSHRASHESSESLGKAGRANICMEGRGTQNSIFKSFKLIKELKIELKQFLQKNILWTSDSWSMSRLFHRPSNPAYYIDCRNWRMPPEDGNCLISAWQLDDYCLNCLLTA